MCGRFTLHHATEDVAAAFAVEQTLLDLKPRYNIAPTQPVACVIQQESRTLQHLQWGLVPSWARDPSVGARMINARSETLASKPAFKRALTHGRCVIPASGYFEWKRLSHGQGRVPMHIHRVSGKPMAFAGLYEQWETPDGATLRTCSIVTTESNDVLDDIHHRMPAILTVATTDSWLDRHLQDPGHLLPLLHPYRLGDLRLHPVADLVNRVSVDVPDCILPVTRSTQSSQLDLGL
ncbi:MAG: SOS response-associated peptidase [Gemmatimonadetes bacterium]|nr:SOS response-associated peptidase [Gemmatimonadota bacterium]MBT6143894.1 SOS response-associated peptidase [Gemmatimonadota bacterium]MBT7861422.1 SOS response-associated peptidase [Gemmatimonadota bacterium]